MLPLQDLEAADAIRWVDLYADGLNGGDLIALLGPICHGELTARMVRDLATPNRYPAGKVYREGEAAITASFRIRRGGEEADGSHFDPVHLLIGEDWLITCWLPPRAIRENPEELGGVGGGSEDLYQAVAEGWLRTEAERAWDLADLVRRELAIACGYRPRA